MGWRGITHNRAMELIKKLFGRPAGAGSGPESAQFHESETATDAGSRNAPRRELVQVVLRDSMRRHGIPSAWIDCRILSVVTRSSRTGMHVQLIVRDGADRLLTYVPAFQRSFTEEIARFDPRVEDWLFSLSWEFHNLSQVASVTMPDPKVWTGISAAAPLTPIATPAPPPAMAPPVREELAPAPVLAVPAPAPVPVRSKRRQAAVVDPVRDQEVQEDLQALYAIRDAAMRQGRPAPAGPSGEQDFESTRPGADDDSAAADLPEPRRW